MIPLFGGTYRQYDLCLDCLDMFGDLFTVFMANPDLDNIFHRYLDKRKVALLSSTH